MMRNLIKIAFVALSLVLLLKTGDAMAASSCNSTYCRVEPSDTLTIDAYGVCYDVSNYPPNIPIYVPIKTSLEWSNFYNHLPSNVTKSVCAPAYSEGSYGPGYSEGGYYSEGSYGPGYSEGAYYSQGSYYSESGYYSQGAYYSQGSYYSESGYYSEGTYYSQGSYYSEPGYYSQGSYYSEPGYYSQGSYYSQGTYYSEGGYYSQGNYYSESSYDEGTCDPLQGPGSYSCECTEVCDVYSELNTNPDALCDCGGATCTLTCGG